jgi:hypothetical protein
MRKLISSAIGVVGLAAALPLFITPMQANAATGCTASSGNSCIKVANQTSSVHSIRVGGRCLTGVPPNTTRTWSSAYVRSNQSTTVLTYTGTSCQGNTQNSENVSWTTSPDGGNYELITISGNSGTGCGAVLDSGKLDTASARPSC